MYTVLRFESPSKDTEKLTFLGESLNQIEDKTFSGLDRIGGRFSCFVCDGDDWEEHTRAMDRFLSAFKQVVAEAQSYGIQVEFDVAIEPEDRANRSYISTYLKPEFLKKLVDGNIGLMLSYYSSQNTAN